MADSKATGPFPLMATDARARVLQIMAAWKERLTLHITNGLKQVLNDIDIRFGGKEMDADKRSLLREQLMEVMPRFEEIMNVQIPRCIDECYGRV